MEGNLLKNGILIALVIIVLVLGAGAFSFYGQTQSQANDLKSKQLALDSMNSSYSDLSSKYATMQSQNAGLREQYEQMNTTYSSISDKYEVLKNQSSSFEVKLGDFLESGPAIAYTYKITADMANNSTMQIVTATAYNVGQQDATNVIASITVSSDNKTGMLTKTIPLVRSMGKGQAVWTIDNTTTVDRVWMGLSS
jgi:type II secretory pathway pseudopilin PulG